MRDAPPSPPDPRSQLQVLLEIVLAARAREQARARENRSTGALEAARADTLLALTDYARAIEDLSWPVPRGIQMEIQMLRSLRTAGRSLPLE